MRPSRAGRGRGYVEDGAQGYVPDWPTSVYCSVLDLTWPRPSLFVCVLFVYLYL